MQPTAFIVKIVIFLGCWLSFSLAHAQVAPLPALEMSNQLTTPAATGKSTDKDKNKDKNKDKDNNKKTKKKNEKSSTDDDDKDDEKEMSKPTRGQTPFQRYVSEMYTLIGLTVFGHNLFDDPPSTFAPVDDVPVSNDYLIGPGDELDIVLWGQFDSEQRVTVDSHGMIYLPRIGNIPVAGIRFGDLKNTLKANIGRLFRNFDLTVSLGQLRTISVYVVGHALRPGQYTVSSLSSLTNLLFTVGGPSASGSLRHIQVRRQGQLIADFDAYRLLVYGDKSQDITLQSGDVINILPAEKSVAIFGEINRPSIYELKNSQHSLQELLQWAGGYSTMAAATAIKIERINPRTKTREVIETTPEKAVNFALQDGDVVQVYPLRNQYDQAVFLTGYVVQPMRKPWINGMKVHDILSSPDMLGTRNLWQIQGRTTWENLKNELDSRLPEINWEYAAIERQDPKTLSTQLIPFNLKQAIFAPESADNLTLQPRDRITIYSRNNFPTAIEYQRKYVRLEGEFKQAGIYTPQPGETLRQLIKRVGGLTDNAFVYGAEFTRETVRVTQQQKLDDAIARFERELIQSSLLPLNADAEPQNNLQLIARAPLNIAGLEELTKRLRTVQAKGRIVFGFNNAEVALSDIPDLPLEDGDRLYIPPKPTTIEIFGSVYSGNTFLFQSNKTTGYYLNLAGGVTRFAEDDNLYLLRADGSVISKNNLSGFSGFEGINSLPGDTIVVPERYDRTPMRRVIRDWTTILYQFGIGISGLRGLR